MSIATNDWKRFLIAAMIACGRSFDYPEMVRALGNSFLTTPGNVDLNELQRWCVAIRLTFDDDLRAARNEDNRLTKLAPYVQP